ncbi:MAG: hypothetical protein GY788_23455, partial [bacterium]|nr:hypothetical protein [bacterium]
AQFSGEARFNKAQFSELARFDKAQFSGEARFNKAQFSELARFDKAQFSGELSFAQAEFEGATYFDKASVNGAGDFGAIRCEGAFSLTGVHFRRVPDFIQAQLAEAPRLDFLTLARNVEPGGLWRSMGRVIRPNVEKSRDLSARYRALKRLAIRGHDHQREQLFFKGELRSQRGGEDLVFSWLLWLGLIYELLSDFGRSIFRPLFWWCVTTGSFAWYYLAVHFADHTPPYSTGVAGWLWIALKHWTLGVLDALSLPQFAVPNLPDLTCLAGIDSDPLLAATLLAIRKGLLVFGFVASEKINQIYACLYDVDPGSKITPVIPDAVAFAGIAQALISAVLIFLLLLAIRNHFRIK